MTIEKLSYDDNGNEILAETTDRSKGERITTKSSYNEDGKILKVETTKRNLLLAIAKAKPDSNDSAVCTFDYDDEGRLIQKTQSDGSVEEYEYFPEGSYLYRLTDPIRNIISEIKYLPDGRETYRKNTRFPKQEEHTFKEEIEETKITYRASSTLWKKRYIMIDDNSDILYKSISMHKTEYVYNPITKLYFHVDSHVEDRSDPKVPNVMNISYHTTYENYTDDLDIFMVYVYDRKELVGKLYITARIKDEEDHIVDYREYIVEKMTLPDYQLTKEVSSKITRDRIASNTKYDEDIDNEDHDEKKRQTAKDEIDKLLSAIGLIVGDKNAIIHFSIYTFKQLDVSLKSYGDNPFQCNNTEQLVYFQKFTDQYHDTVISLFVQDNDTNGEIDFNEILNMPKKILISIKDGITLRTPLDILVEFRSSDGNFVMEQGSDIYVRDPRDSTMTYLSGYVYEDIMYNKEGLPEYIRTDTLNDRQRKEYFDEMKQELLGINKGKYRGDFNRLYSALQSVSKSC